MILNAPAIPPITIICTQLEVPWIWLVKRTPNGVIWEPIENGQEGVEAKTKLMYSSFR